MGYLIEEVTVRPGDAAAASGGRAASIARRRALSQGKAALPGASERVRSGFRDATLPTDAGAARRDAPIERQAEVSQPVPQMVSVSKGRQLAMNHRKAQSQGKIGVISARDRLRAARGGAPTPETETPTQATHVQATQTVPQEMPEGGRAASIARRRALSQGKAALPPVQERVRTGFREADLPNDVSVQLSRAETASMPAATAPTVARQGSLKYPPKVPSVTTAVSKASVTGISHARGRAVTGDEAGRDKPLTGTQYVAGEEGAYRAASGKVGLARTERGLAVSGTLVRSKVRITGDESRVDSRITGNADQRSDDDLTPRSESFVAAGAQFARQAQPHGHSVFGSNLGRSIGTAGSRSRETTRSVEQTLGGHAVSGTPVGRSPRVTGDENGAHRSLTGTQYLAPASHQAAQVSDTDRTDPATGTKVSASRTWSGQTVTGPQMEHNERVTGSEPGTCQVLTGTPYFGATVAEGWCEPESAETEAVLRGRHTPPAVTGDVPMHDPAVSGTDRGANRAITGSTYFVTDEARRDTESDPVSRSITGFSIGSPQRLAHLSARAAEPQSPQPSTSAITGTFAQGEGKVTGNVEFMAPSAKARTGAPAHRSVTGEGAVTGSQITGSAWSDDPRVTGTEGFIAASRNLSDGAPHGQPFAGARRFKSDRPAPEPNAKVTGSVGGPASRAAVTLSGGAAG